MTAPAVSVVIPSKNGGERLGPTLASLAAQQTSLAFEVVVVDDGSDDATSELASRAALPFGTPRVVRHANSLGRASACNRGVAEAKGEVVLILDDDMTALAGVVETHRAFHATNAGAAARGRVTLAEPAVDSCFARFLRREEAFELERLRANADSLPFPLSQTGHFSIRRQVLQDAGGFDGTIAAYGFEDIDLGYRLTRRGIRLAFLPEAQAIHRAFMTDLTRYLERHREAGSVARALAEHHGDGEFREYLRVDPPRSLTAGNASPGLAALRLTNRLLLRRSIRRALGSKAGFGALRAVLRAGEWARLDRLVHFGYHVARDVRYYEGYHGERSPSGPS